MKRIWWIGAALAAAPAQAEVKSASASHFLVESKAVAAATPTEAYVMLGRIGEWWSSDHTYSGSARNLSLDLRGGGCFCEKLPKDGGSVEHLRIVYAQPGVRLRASGGLGPLQAEPVAGTLTWSFKAVPGGTEITQSYAVSGHSAIGGLDTLAPHVDRMLAEQLASLQKRLAR